MGSDVQSDYAKARRKLGVVPQELVFDPFFNVREALRSSRATSEFATTTPGLTSCSSSLGLADKAGANMRQLSGGMKRRMLVAQALVHKPRVIVLDEPTAGVDVELRQTLVAVHCQAQQAGAYRLVDHALSGRSRGSCADALPCSSGACRGSGPHQRPCSRRFQQCACASRLMRTAASTGGQGAHVTGRIVQFPAHMHCKLNSTLRLCASLAGGPRCRNPQGRSGRCVSGRDEQEKRQTA
jgi:ABC-2 type transport system ATP-binding protein